MTTRRFFLQAATVTAAMSAAAGTASIASVSYEADPVFAMIERHKRLWAIHGAACDEADIASEAFGPDSPEEAAAYERQGAACEADISALRDVIAAVPTSEAGMLAYLDHIESRMGFGCIVPDGDNFEAIIATVRQFIAGPGH